MKKILIFLSLSLFAVGTFAQEANNLKNFRFGLKVAPSLDWMRPDVKSVESNGAVVKFAYGLITEFRLSNIISLSTGIEGTYSGGILNFKDSAIYFVNNGELIKQADTTGKTKTSQYQLKSREYSISYVTIPVTLKMKTNDINGITYFGMFGGDLHFRAKATASDQLTNLRVAAGSNFDATNIDITSDVSFFRVNLNVGAGIEYNLSGSTSLLAGLNYRRSFNSIPSSESDYLQQGRLNTAKFKQTSYIDGISLTVGILF